jgi:hypothetical protein
MPPDGLEGTPQNAGKTGFTAERGTESGTVQDADGLKVLLAELAKLSAEDRARLAAMLAAGAGDEVAPPLPLGDEH